MKIPAKIVKVQRIIQQYSDLHFILDIKAVNGKGFYINCCFFITYFMCHMYSNVLAFKLPYVFVN